MALPKQKEYKAPRTKDPDRPAFDPYWTSRSGKVDHVEQYIQTACREPKGWFRGARIR